mmetsp:Transcript_5524/g.5678  ORF Transcript_5524/g.5678 Transcript_5524/m.5678 type:complete len:192 (+) Transcript_5524:99-674(+)
MADFKLQNISEKASEVYDDNYVTEEDEKNYENCLHDEELKHSAWLERIKISSAENYEAGYLAGRALCVDSPDKPVKNPDDVRSRLFETIPLPSKLFNLDSFQRVRITDPEEEEIDKDTVDACLRLKTCMKLREKWISGHPYPPQDIRSTFFAFRISMRLYSKDPSFLQACLTSNPYPFTGYRRSRKVCITR